MTLAWLAVAVPLTAALATGCASSRATTVVESRELDQADGRPRVSAVLDAGGIDIPSLGVLRPQASDGAAVIGETLWIRGSDFGRQPTVSIGGRAAAVVSRTADGGILVRVPPRTPAGQQALVVTQEHGQASFTVQVRRLGGVVAGGQLGFFALDAGGPRDLDSGPHSGIRHLQLSADGRAAYALDTGGNLRVFELPASGGPTEVRRVELGAGESRALLAATAAPRMLLLRKDEILVFDTARALHPVPAAGHPLPGWLRGDRVQGAALSPDGRWLALALAQKNRVVILAVDRLGARDQAAAPGGGEQRRADLRAGELLLLPEVLAPTLVDLTFAPDARTLWVLSGGTEENRSIGPRPTEVHALRLSDGAGGRNLAGGDTLRVERARVVALDGAERPVSLSTGRNLPLASGSAVRLPPERATVFVAARAAGAGATIYAVGEGEPGNPLFTEGALTQVGRLDVTPDGALVVGAFLDRDGRVRIAAAPGDGRPGAIRSTVVLPAAAGGPGGGLGQTELRLQP